ncbi:GNAT family N-acetyltransferase [Rhizobium rhizophilum]|uniref:GNAT family N-acetyltransferase n=1 Tax=Rhizobium rhizophilum TaxID=1850373 RepID=A0ABY2QTA9_9HYPH|nr:GNAT family N-acetyltransferase [Rhizobium rhizophilum]THV12457.1 GNAT family N-acetyltransferase [Rhizobium rhizophilum]
MNLTLREGDREAFFDAPFNAYPPQIGYVSPMRGDLMRMLDPAKNPLWQAGSPFRFWTVHRAGMPVGRIIAHLHRQSNERWGGSRAQFGFFDCADDPQAARMLLDAAEGFARDQGMTELVGNFNLTAMQQCGVMTGGFEETAYTDMIVGPPWLPGLLEANGFSAFFPMTTFEIDLARPNPPPAALDRARYTFAPIRKGTFLERMEEARLLLNDGFHHNPMFVPLTPEEFQFQAGELSTILDPRLSSVLKRDGVPVGVIIAIPDLNGFLKATRSRVGLTTPWHFLRYRMNRKRAVIIFYSVARAAHGQGIMSAMLAETLGRVRAAGYETIGGTWIADENPASRRQVEKMNGRWLHKLHLFRKDIA